MIEWKNVSYKIMGKTILNDVSLFARDGEISVIIGKNGSGKTSLIRTAFLTRGKGLSGEILINGKPKRDFSHGEFDRKIALMPQNLPTPDISVEELVRLARSPWSGIFGRLHEKDIEAAERAMDSLDLLHLRKASLLTLSGGERQRAYFAMLIAKDAENIFLDEPSSSLDLPSKAELLSFVKALKADGKCVILVMHDLSDALRIADKIYLMDAGKISPSMSVSEFVSSDIPERIFSSKPYKIVTESGEDIIFKAL